MPKIIQISKSEYFQGFHNGKYFFIMEILILYSFEKKDFCKNLEILTISSVPFFICKGN